VNTNNVVQNNVISHYGVIMPSFRAAVHVDGVGISALHNNISYAPHQGIQIGGTLGGNNCVIDGNHIWDVLQDTSDNGAIYTGGNDPTQRGSSITNNFIEDVYAKLTGSTAIWGIMLDSHGSGYTITGNLIRNVNSGMIFGGSRDCWVQNNVITNVVTNGIQIDDRCGDKWPSPTFLTNVNYLSAPYSVQYPLLTTLLTDYPAYPEGNVFELNGIEANIPLKIRTGDGEIAVNSTVRNPYWVGWINNVGAFGLFTNEPAGDYSALPGSALALAGFQALNTASYGAVNDGYLSVPTPDPTP